MHRTRRPLLVVGLLVGPLVLADAAHACPWTRCSCCPPPVYYVPLPPVVIEPAPPAPPPKPPETAPEVDAAALYKQVVDSSAFIVTPLKGGLAMGSGTLIDAAKRYVLTNYHMVENADKVYVQFPVHLKDGSILAEKKKYIDRIPAGEAIIGRVLYRDKARDLALIQLDKLAPTAKAIKLAKKSVEVGATVWAVGSPGAVPQVFAVTEGSVRAVGNEDFEYGDGTGAQHVRCRMVTVTNQTSPGDSGGPLVDRRGELVGVTESETSGVQQLSRIHRRAGSSGVPEG